MRGRVTDRPPAPACPVTDWRAGARLLGPRDSARCLPAADVLLGVGCLLIAAVSLSLLARFGVHAVYVADLAVGTVIAAAQPWRRARLRASALVTAAGLASYAVLTLLSPVSLGVSPLALTALTTLHACVRWDPDPRWGRGAVAVSLAGCLVNPVNMLVLGRNRTAQQSLTAAGTVDLLMYTTVCLLAVVLVTADALRRRHLAQERVREREAVRRRAVDEERLRLARELHDLIGHSLTAVKVRAGTALALEDPGAHRAALVDVERTAAASLEEVRELVRVLRAPGEGALAPADLGAVHEALAAVRAAGLEVEAQLPAAADLTALGQGWGVHQRLAVLRCAQEALTNALRHGAGHATLSLWEADGACRLTVTNTLTAPARPTEPGSGLSGLAERVRLVGGALSTGVVPGPGGARFVLDVTVPVTARRKEHHD
ncbi:MULTISPECIES: histidine kinase [unclassified Actinomyces]|uniref:sensor histidine kinase n=1 Tax=unclassified Actinomyces TaxID=2609248 RepID=UPI0020178EF2|nr:MULTISPECIES: histidine kinase [unclassified Actinomyces]MCL3776707.1 sensor histidine kinase [Actinomyces sp. AC-20-1]MCL3790538.1 sensor histidine kinase [Actinomyces sp. 187325]MCL3792834.1 sensor histidine kinase [Actinomyces sp. 186855]MCL3795304.1 sensor histidine kinase [Actinomyces sp. 217892]